MSYEADNTALLKTILNASFFKCWEEDPTGRYSNRLEAARRDVSLEIYITSDCNQKCSYCYLHTRGDKLYPAHLRSEDNLIKNMRILMSHLVKKWPRLERIDLFSGELLNRELAFKLFDVMLEAKNNGAGFVSIVIPSNFSFILSTVQAQRVQEYIDRFQECGVRVIISASLDGALIESRCRGLKDESLEAQRNYEFYDKAFEFATKNGYGFHPMLAAPMMKYWIENYKWYADQCKKYELDPWGSIMTLEVRNADWTDEFIEDYKKFLRFYADYHLENTWGGSVDRFAAAMFGYTLNGTSEAHGYHNLLLLDAVQIPTCSIGHELAVRLGDLAICPCHRTSYDELLYGRFIVENSEIVDIEGYNPALAAKILLMNQRVTHHGCDTCWNVNSCVRQCFGCQYEEGQEIFMPVPNVCRMLKEKTRTIIEICEQYNLLERAEKACASNPTSALKAFIETFKKLRDDARRHDDGLYS